MINTKRPNILIDESIPLARELFSTIGSVTTIPANKISQSTLLESDALVVRSITPVNEALLKDSRVVFVGSATIGKDHLDENWLSQNKIKTVNAPGCNSRAVVQYIISGLIVWAIRQKRKFRELKVGVVGCGQIGSRLAKLLTFLNVDVFVCDPILAAQNKLPIHRSIKELANECDVLSFHVPLTRGGQNATHGMINNKLLSQFSNAGLIINSSRGKLLVEADLLNWIKDGGNAILDVWPEEPHITDALLNSVFIGTPHIAGYSLEGKYRASLQVFHQLATFFGVESRIAINQLIKDKIMINDRSVESIDQFLLSFYSIEKDWRSFKAEYQQKGSCVFTKLRDNYSLRREYASWEFSKSIELAHSRRNRNIKFPEEIIELKQFLNEI